MKKVFRKELTIRGKDDNMTKLSLDSSLKIEQQEKKNVRIKRRVAILVQRKKWMSKQTRKRKIFLESLILAQDKRWRHA